MNNCNSAPNPEACRPDSEAPLMEEGCKDQFAHEDDMCCDTACGSDAPPNETPDLQAEPEMLQKQVVELKDKLLRLHAEMDNLRKRNQRELEGARKYANEKILQDLLPVKDALDLGVEAGKENPAKGEKILEGVVLIQQMLTNIFERNKIQIIAPLGEKFNPELHEAIAMMPSPDYDSNVVMQVIQPGYQLNGRVTRPARVVVSRGQPLEPQEEPQDTHEEQC